MKEYPCLDRVAGSACTSRGARAGSAVGHGAWLLEGAARAPRAGFDDNATTKTISHIERGIRPRGGRRAGSERAQRPSEARTPRHHHSTAPKKMKRPPLVWVMST